MSKIDISSLQHSLAQVSDINSLVIESLREFENLSVNSKEGLTQIISRLNSEVSAASSPRTTTTPEQNVVIDVRDFESIVKKTEFFISEDEDFFV